MYQDGLLRENTLIPLSMAPPENLFLLESYEGIQEFINTKMNICVGSHVFDDKSIDGFLRSPSACDIRGASHKLDDLVSNLEKSQVDLIRPYRKIFNILADAFPNTKARLTIKLINDQMCPLFHEDNIHIRFITTLKGKGTQWLSDDHVARKNLSKGKNKRIIKEDAILREIRTKDIAIMKGKKNKTSLGLVHRSPPIDPCCDESRLMLRFDLI